MTANILPPVTSVDIIAERLKLIFPEGTPNRNYCVRELAASTVFTFLYIGAVEGNGISLSPKHVYRMSDEQSLKQSDAERLLYHVQILRPGATIEGVPWYSDTTRESIRDETLKEGFVSLGVVQVNPSIPTTSSKPRYTLSQPFAALFHEQLTGEKLLEQIALWQQQYLSASTLAMHAILQSGASAPHQKVSVTLPTKEIRYMDQGPSTLITKAVIEEFAFRYLKNPYVLWISESGNKMGPQEMKMAQKLNLQIDPSKHLPDIILVDVSPKPFFVFVEVVATDGPMTETRINAFFAITDAAGYPRDQVIFVTALRDRQSKAVRKAVSAVAWNSYMWFQSEPDSILFSRPVLFT